MLKKRVYEILEIAKKNDTASRIFDIFILSLISLNIIAVILSTVETLSIKYFDFFRFFEVFSVSVFTVEYILRVWSCTANEQFHRPYIGRIKYIATPLAFIDLFAILPFYLPMFIPLDLRFIRAFRLFRIFRIFKMSRYSRSMRTLKEVLKEKKEELLLVVFVAVVLLIIFSSLMYFIEKDVQPEAFSSIPAAMWWGIMTLTTVGYGDIYPITILGKILGVLIAFLGIGLFALPAGILGSGLVEAVQKSKNNLQSKRADKAINDEIEDLKKSMNEIKEKLDKIKNINS